MREQATGAWVFLTTSRLDFSICLMSAFVSCLVSHIQTSPIWFSAPCKKKKINTWSSYAKLDNSSNKKTAAEVEFLLRRFSEMCPNQLINEYCDNGCQCCCTFMKLLTCSSSLRKSLYSLLQWETSLSTLRFLKRVSLPSSWPLQRALL